MADAAKKFVDGLKRRTTALLFIQLVVHKWTIIS